MFSKKVKQVGTAAGYNHNKGFWTLIATMVFAVICLIHIESSRAKAQEITKTNKVVVERIPSSEARKMGVDSRNN